MSGYIGTQPVPQATQTRDAFTATNNQTSFPTSGYTPEFLDVFLNGVKLAASDYTATNGSDVVLAAGATTGDILEVVSYGTFEVLNPTFDGNVTFTGNASFGDNDKAIFGSELEIYSDATHARIREYGSGQLKIQGDNMQLLTSNGASTYLEGNASTSAVTLYHASNSPRLATTSTGIEVTGGINYTSGTLNYTGTSVPTGANNQGLYVPSYAIGLGGTYASLNFPTTSSALTTTAWWMLGRAGGSNDQFTLRVRRGGTSAADQTAYVVTTSGADSAKIVDSHKWYTGGSNGTERMRIDASGNVGIGTSNPASWAKLDILGSGGSQTGATQALQVKAPSATAGEGVGIRLNAASGSHEAVGIIGMVNNASGNAGSMTFHTYDGGATIPERMRIDNSGNLLVGKTTGAFATVGTKIQSDGQTEITAYNGGSLYLNRLSSDGLIVGFYKNSSSVGSIGVNNSDNLTVQGNSGHSGIEFGTNAIFPHKNSANVDNTIDLGEGSLRWKDLYLSGGVYLGGTGSANKLEDYEEGSWTPTTDGTNPTVAKANYTKIGNSVTIFVYLHNLSNSTSDKIHGLPFTPSANMYASARYHSNSSNYWRYVLRTNANDTSLRFLDSADAGVAITTATNNFLVFSLTYETNA